jgi:hypothetical protein
VEDYVPPKEDEERTDAAQELNVCLKGRGVFFYYERYQTRYGEKAAASITDGVRDLFNQAFDKLSWIDQRKTENKTLIKVYDSMSDKRTQLNSGKPISRAGLDLRPYSEAP